MDGILDITIGAGGASNGDGNDTIVKYDSKTITITMNKGKKEKYLKGEMEVVVLLEDLLEDLVKMELEIQVLLEEEEVDEVRRVGMVG